MNPSFHSYSKGAKEKEVEEERVEEENPLSAYVSNLDRDIYTVSQIPEEVIATAFAYVSRSPSGLRENLLKVTEEKSKNFHEKWVLGYGHASVAELAVIHLGIERVSRLFSALLERSNLYMSPIEYSQRYQKPKLEGFHVPEELEQYPELKKEYLEYHQDQYQDYEKLLEGLYSFYEKKEDAKENENPKAYKKRLEKQSFEDARYVLSLAIHTNMGLTTNARALEKALTCLFSSSYSEVQKRAQEIKEEALRVCPTLLRYAEASTCLQEWNEKIRHTPKIKNSPVSKASESVDLLGYSGKQSGERVLLKEVLAEFLYSLENRSWGEIGDLIDSKAKSGLKSGLEDFFLWVFSDLPDHQDAPDCFEKIVYQVEFCISEACWHQLLRHRKMRFCPQDPSNEHGFVIPPAIQEAGLTSLFEKAIERSSRIFDRLKIQNPLVAHYTLSNAHKRRTLSQFSLWELYHLIQIRLTPQAQWEIKQVIQGLTKKIQTIHPTLLQPAIHRLKKRLPHSNF